MKLSMVSIEREGYVRLSVGGTITAKELTAIPGNLFEALLGASWNSNRVLLNMMGVNYIDSGAIGWLIGSHKAFASNGGTLVLHDVSPQVRQVLDILRLDKVLRIATTEAAAREMVLGSNLAGAH